MVVFGGKRKRRVCNHFQRGKQLLLNTLIRILLQPAPTPISQGNQKPDSDVLIRQQPLLLLGFDHFFCILYTLCAPLSLLTLIPISFINIIFRIITFKTSYNHHDFLALVTSLLFVSYLKCFSIGL